jgi:hypothetical protein
VTLVLWAILLVIQSGPQPPDRLIGLLTLPDVLGHGPCDRFTPRDLVLHTAPDGPPAGTIRVVREWTHLAEGGCEGLEVRVQGPDSNDLHPLPVAEFQYEDVAAIALEQRGRWFRLRLETGSAWVRASDRDEFHPLERLLIDGLAHFTPDWDRRLSERPGASSRNARGVTGQDEPSARVIRSETAGAVLWLFVEVMSHSGCEGGEAPRVVDRGWVPAHTASGRPTLWFYSRGC